MQPRSHRGPLAAATALVLGVGLSLLAPGTASASPTSRALTPGTRFFVPPPVAGAVQQITGLVKSGDLKDAELLAGMEAVPSAVWLTGGTPAQVGNQVRTTLAEAAAEQAEPVFVVYDIPGRDCSEYSAGGAADQAAYEGWIDAVASAVGRAHAVLLVEPDALGNEPSDCNLPVSAYPHSDDERTAEVGYAAAALEKDPNARVYLDGTNPHWQAVGTITRRLLSAGVLGTQGFFLNVSNFRTNAESQDYGSWISDCIAMTSDSSHWAFGHPEYCASQYYPATVDDFSTWGRTSAWYDQNLGGAVPTTHYVVDTSRNGQPVNTMAQYGAAPYNQSAATVATLMQGNWCNPTDAGLGVRPTANTGVPLLDADLWVKTPGESDGGCDALGGVRAWDYGAYSLPGWPTDAASQAQFDPLWGQVDPAAGAWFPAQALQLARLASPRLG
ncbi:glycoside hydrolase family 6 protein [Streptacidiphilus rugosus]|uniref:glycoside hydrolase family 6 protein n=1 Tax=Streptacidiphilus rugosus TaxID=405783 RepID=UPI000568638E|nr:glycoside hydrolase family 6 protein [Streptacidiphilus rugosus]